MNNINAETVEVATRPYTYALNHRNYIVEGNTAGCDAQPEPFH